MLELERLTQERVVEQVDLPDREIVRGAPVSINAPQFLLGELTSICLFLFGHAGAPFRHCRGHLLSGIPGCRTCCARLRTLRLVHQAL